ncbi:MAG TPA: hypothetical protein VFM06_11850 [Candidatus Limnocylindria bacterium]|nr:hypothetical protein [Candidatus Limnocylindria bacterium]
MKRACTLLLVVLQLAGARPALGWDPFDGPAFDEGPSGPPDPAPLVVPDGLYAVTDVYAGDVVSTTGNTTVYSTVTVRDDPGTFARVVDVVGTGRASRFDGASFNGRGRMPDGRSVAGTYYESFVLTSSGYISVGFVFFQDDSATRDVPAPTAPPPASPGAPVPSSTPAIATPLVPRPPAATSVPPTARPLPAVTAGVALAPTAPVLASMEVLRGRTTELWLQAFVDGVPIAVRSWRFLGGSVDALTPSAGSASDPCVVTWLTLAPPGTTLTLRFTVETATSPVRTAEAAIRVIVRSPALLE